MDRLLNNPGLLLRRLLTYTFSNPITQSQMQREDLFNKLAFFLASDH